MKNKIILGIAVCVVALGFVLGATGVVNPVNRAGEEQAEAALNEAFLSPCGILIVRSDAPELPKDEKGRLYGEIETKVDADNNEYYDCIFDYPRTYGMLQFQKNNCTYGHCDPVFYDTHFSVNYHDQTSQRMFAEAKLSVEDAQNIMYWIYVIYQNDAGEVFADLEERTQILSEGFQISVEQTIEKKVDGKVVRKNSGGGAVQLERGEKPKEFVISEYDESGAKLCETRYEAGQAPDGYHVPKRISAFAVVETVYSDHSTYEIITPSEDSDKIWITVFDDVEDGMFTFKSIYFAWVV